MQNVCPLSHMVLPNNFKNNQHIIAIKTGDGTEIHVYKDGLCQLLCKIGIKEKKLLNEIRRFNPGETFDRIEGLLVEAADDVSQFAKITAEKSGEKAEETVKKIEAILARLAKTFSLDITTLTPSEP